jgi:2-oxo-4-hydroxy-4-carboxy-5-ureidoimidazoline decarboxylase
MTDLCAYLNDLPDAEARAALLRCCGAARWVDAMLAARPFRSTTDVYDRAEGIWAALSDADVLEAFGHHPRIGENLALLRARYAAHGADPDAGAFSAREQAKVAEASEATLLALRDGNRAYEQKFGFIFLVFASGKSADEMLALLRARLPNDRSSELATARREHAKITQLRLSKLAP